MDEDEAATDEPLDAAAALQLARVQQHDVESRIAGFVPTLMLSWAVAWIVGFGAMWLVEGLRPAFALPLPVAGGILAGAVILASGASIWLGIRSGRGIRSTRGVRSDTFTGTVYGVAWSAGATTIFLFGQGLFVNGMTAALAALFYPAAFVAFAGLMYLLSGAIWNEVVSVVLGPILLLVAIVGLFLGSPGHNLLYALAGGGAFLVAGLILRSRTKPRGRRRD